jgi:hypothetical protein
MGQAAGARSGAAPEGVVAAGVACVRRFVGSETPRKERKSFCDTSREFQESLAQRVPSPDRMRPPSLASLAHQPTPRAATSTRRRQRASAYLPTRLLCCTRSNLLRGTEIRHRQVPEAQLGTPLPRLQMGSMTTSPRHARPAMARATALPGRPSVPNLDIDRRLRRNTISTDPSQPGKQPSSNLACPYNPTATPLLLQHLPGISPSEVHCPRPNSPPLRARPLRPALAPHPQSRHCDKPHLLSFPPRPATDPRTRSYVAQGSAERAHDVQLSPGFHDFPRP